MIKAKPIVENEFWILTKGDRKVGEVSANPCGLNVRVDKHNITIKDLSNLRDKFGIEVDTSIDPTVSEPNITDVHGYPADGEINEPMWDIQNNLPLYTKQENSKSLYAAGWYNITIKHKTKTVFCPKLIILQRNYYEGPFKEEPLDNEFGHLFE